MCRDIQLRNHMLFADLMQSNFVTFGRIVINMNTVELNFKQTHSKGILYRRQTMHNRMKKEHFRLDFVVFPVNLAKCKNESYIILKFETKHTPG